MGGGSIKQAAERDNKLEDQVQYICTQQGCQEHRQCGQWGEATGVARYVCSWCRGDTAQLTERHAAISFEHLQMLGGEVQGMQYSQIFEGEDTRRKEGLAAHVYQCVIEPGGHLSSFKSPSEQGIGKLSKHGPSWINAMLREHTKNCITNETQTCRCRKTSPY